MPSPKVLPVRKPLAEMTDPELVDHFGELDRQVNLFEPTKQEHEAAKKLLIERVADEPADRPASLQGKRYRVQFGAKRNERTITSQVKAFRALEAGLGKSGAIAAVTIPLGAVDKCVPDSVQKGFIAREQAGTRTVEAVPLNPLAA